jgi:hypothetical protein
MIEGPVSRDTANFPHTAKERNVDVRVALSRAIFSITSPSVCLVGYFFFYECRPFRLQNWILNCSKSSCGGAYFFYVYFRGILPLELRKSHSKSTFWSQYIEAIWRAYRRANRIEC